MRRSIPLVVVTSLCFAAAGCASEAPSQSDETRADETAAAGSAELESEAANPNPALFPKDAHPYGVSTMRWSELLWKWVEEQPLAHNPDFDKTGADCAVDQEGPVWFLASVPGDMLGDTVVRSCTIPRGRAILLQLASILNDYPCPDPTFHPAPGQSLYDFLRDGATQAIDKSMMGMGGFDVTLDGTPINDPLQYRYTSDNLFHFTGDISLQSWDSCVTGKRQVGVSDGFYLMFKPLKPGTHTIVVSGHMMGMNMMLTEHLTIR